jgi:FimV-like protein
VPESTIPISANISSGKLYNGWSSVSVYGPVPVGASLSQIAGIINKSKQLTRDQVMQSIVTHNPNAFCNKSDPSCLLVGSFLHVPTFSQVKAEPPYASTAWIKYGSYYHPAAKMPVATNAHHPLTAKGRVQPKLATKLTLSSAHVAGPAVGATSSTKVAAPTASVAPLKKHYNHFYIELKKEDVALTASVAHLTAMLSLLHNQLIANGVEVAKLKGDLVSQKEEGELVPLLSILLNVILLALFGWLFYRQRKSATLLQPESPIVDTAFVDTVSVDSVSSDLAHENKQPKEAKKWFSHKKSRVDDAAGIASGASHELPVQNPHPAEVVSSSERSDLPYNPTSTTTLTDKSAQDADSPKQDFTPETFDEDASLLNELEFMLGTKATSSKAASPEVAPDVVPEVADGVHLDDVTSPPVEHLDYGHELPYIKPRSEEDYLTIDAGPVVGPIVEPVVEPTVEPVIEATVEPAYQHIAVEAEEQETTTNEEWDRVGTQLDLAQAYVDMGDTSSAIDLLEQVAQDGNSKQKERAATLLAELK